MPGAPYLIDSNILLRWVKPDDRDYSLINTVVESLINQGCPLYYTSQNLAEFWNTCTRPTDRNGYGLSIEETDSRSAVIENTLSILADSLAVHWEWRRLIVAYRVSGVQVHDARLVAAMQTHGVRRILTLNERDFVRYDAIQALNPKALISQMP